MDCYHDPKHTSYLQTQYRMSMFIALTSNEHMYDGIIRPYYTNKEICLKDLRKTADGKSTREREAL